MRKLPLAENEHITFDIYFSGIVAMQQHPGAGLKKEGYDKAADKLSVEECADIALEMIEVRRQVMAVKPQ